MLFINKILNIATVCDKLNSWGIIMVKIHLSRLLGERRISQKTLSELTGIRPNTISDWYNEIAISLKVEHIDKICEVLQCSLDELIEVIPNKTPKTGKYLIVEEHGNRKPKEKGNDK